MYVMGGAALVNIHFNFCNVALPQKKNGVILSCVPQLKTSIRVPHSEKVQSPDFHTKHNFFCHYFLLFSE